MNEYSYGEEYRAILREYVTEAAEQHLVVAGIMREAFLYAHCAIPETR